MSSDTKSGDVLELIVKRDDGLPDITVTTEPDGSWQLTAAPTPNIGPVKFTIHHGIRKVGEHTITFTGIPLTAEIISGTYPTMPFNADSVVTYQLKNEDGTNYTATEGEYISIHAEISGYEDLHIPIPTNGIVEVPWSKTSVGVENHELKNAAGGVLDEHISDYVAVGEVVPMYHRFSTKIGEVWTLFGTVKDVDGKAIAGIPVQVRSLSDEYPFETVLVSDEHGIVMVKLDSPAGTKTTSVEFEMSSGGKSDTVDVTWSSTARTIMGRIELDPVPTAVPEYTSLNLTGTLRNAAGAIMKTAFIFLYTKTEWGDLDFQTSEYTDNTGRFSINITPESGVCTYVVATAEDFIIKDIEGEVVPYVERLTNGTLKAPHGESLRIPMACRDRLDKVSGGTEVTFKYDSVDSAVVGTMVGDKDGLVYHTIPWSEINGQRELFAIIGERDVSIRVEGAAEGEVVPKSIKMISHPTHLHPYQPAIMGGYVFGSDGEVLTQRASVIARSGDFDTKHMFSTDDTGYFELSVPPQRPKASEPNKVYVGIGMEMSIVDVTWDDGTAPVYDFYRFDNPSFPDGVTNGDILTFTGKMRAMTWEDSTKDTGPIELTAKVVVDTEIVSTHTAMTEEDSSFSIDIIVPASGEKFDLWLSTPDGGHSDRMTIWVGPERVKKIEIVDPTPSSIAPGTTSLDVGCRYLDEFDNPISGDFITIYTRDLVNGGWTWCGNGLTNENGYMYTTAYIQPTDSLDLRFVVRRTEKMITIPVA
ncbi:hypothetical protein [Vibrio phage pTD1]|uniref:Uncharacterized protein n=1 Tax=Vibrio phage pTD1 TaxID=1938577 RepID=A0A1Q2U328_9CAUD|nr:hypothetical protein FDH33_gp157 [Vibrio phage pTD1]BAW98366.1 hypothetical protein [Vibrio phage pTD1]